MAGRKKTKIIDVGDQPTEKDPDGQDEEKDEDEDKEKDDDVDPDLAEDAANAALAAEGESVGDDDIEIPEPKSTRGGSLARRDPMAAYMNEVRRYPLLTPEEEKSLATRLVEHGDTSAARKLIEANLRLVVKIAYEYRRAHKNLLDLVQEGNIGLIQAVGKFDPYRGVKLSSYAAFWIRAYILKFILNNWRLVKIGTTQAQRKLFFNLRKEREKLEREGYEVGPKLLAERLDVSEAEVNEMSVRLGAPDLSLDAPSGRGDDDNAHSPMDRMPSASAGRPDRQVEGGEFRALLREKLEQFAKGLKGREETIFRERLLNDAPLTLQEIGEKYGISRERARQLEKRLVTRLRGYLEKELGEAVAIGASDEEP